MTILLILVTLKILEISKLSQISNNSKLVKEGLAQSLLVYLQLYIVMLGILKYHASKHKNLEFIVSTSVPHIEICSTIGNDMG